MLYYNHKEGGEPGERRRLKPKGCAQRRVTKGPEGVSNQKKKKGNKKMKTYTLYRAVDAITLTADELLAAFDEAEKNGYHIEKLENEKVWGENAYMIYYW